MTTPVTAEDAGLLTLGRAAAVVGAGVPDLCDVVLDGTMAAEAAVAVAEERNAKLCVPEPGPGDPAPSVLSSARDCVREEAAVGDGGATYACNVCEKRFKRRCHVYDHYRRVHEAIRPYSCPACDGKFPQKSSRDRHYKVVHLGQKAYACELCDKAFGKKHALTVHIRTVHERQKPFCCDQCNQTFGVRSHLNKHVRIVHDRQRPHQCDECPQAFGERSDLKKHQRAVHNRVDQPTSTSGTLSLVARPG